MKIEILFLFIVITLAISIKAHGGEVENDTQCLVVAEESSYNNGEIKLAHGGGLNSCGCHFNRKTGECHCHRNKGCGCSCQPSSCESLKVEPNESLQLVASEGEK